MSPADSETVRRHRLRHQRTRALVEEHETVLSVADVLSHRGRQLTLTVPATGDETKIDAAALLVPHRQRAFAMGRTILRYYFACPACHCRRLLLYPALVGRTVLLRCRFCLGLRYQSETHGRSDDRVLLALERRAESLARRPGPKGRRFRAMSRRLRRVQVLEAHRQARLPGRAWADVQRVNPQTSAREIHRRARPSRLTRAHAEREARETARRDFPPPPWRRANPRQRIRVVSPRASPPMPSRGPAPVSLRPHVVRSIPPVRYYPGPA